VFFDELTYTFGNIIIRIFKSFELNLNHIILYYWEYFLYF